MTVLNRSVAGTVARPTRFHGTVTVDAARVGRDAGQGALIEEARQVSGATLFDSVYPFADQIPISQSPCPTWCAHIPEMAMHHYYIREQSTSDR